MSINKFEKDMNIIKALPDEPNDVGGLSADQLKSKFDEGGNALKDYINEEIVPALEDLSVIAEGAAHTILDKSGNEMPQRGKMKFNGEVTDDGVSTIVGFTAEDVGARPDNWLPAADEIGAAAVEHIHKAGDITSGEISVSRGGTGASTAAEARANLEIPTITYGSAAPSGGSNGDIYFQYI